jgi:hypothetical protein
MVMGAVAKPIATPLPDAVTVTSLVATPPSEAVISVVSEGGGSELEK